MMTDTMKARNAVRVEIVAMPDSRMVEVGLAVRGMKAVAITRSGQMEIVGGTTIGAIGPGKEGLARTRLGSR